MLGGPGSGKSTQCNKIVDKYNFTYLNTGSILQEEIDTGSDGGKMIAKTITEGGHIPDYIVLGLLFNGIVKHVHQSVGFIIDGYIYNFYILYIYNIFTQLIFNIINIFLWYTHTH